MATEASAATWQDLDAVDAIVVAAAGGVGVARPVDRRMKLAACPETLTVGAPAAGSITVGCATIGWRIRVPMVTTISPTTVLPLIRKGDPVSVVTGADGFSASVSGIAESEGPLGARVRVRTGPGAAGVIVGLVADPGTVRIY
ncbi:flagella basal body P-ring formation protein FlgA [Sphingomonas sp.]|uniref:flagella basal body P-ring formation protein FlgA n=1 Tax=Sphingomonas sp. TaxID=28214 RepID=UPI0025D290C3|nr:flagella basal body P-ring formation protein FlgA [Sphingomonas sp.]